MNTKTNLSLGVFLGITMVFALASPASARGRFGGSLGGPIGVHVGTRSGVGVSLPTPQAGVGWDGPADVSVAVDPHGVRLNGTGPYGSSAGISSDGDFFVGASENLPGGASVSGGVDQNGPSADADVEVPLEPITYAGTY